MCEASAFRHYVDQGSVEKKFNTGIRRESVINAFQYFRVVDETADLFGVFVAHHLRPGAARFPEPVINFLPESGGEKIPAVGRAAEERQPSRCSHPSEGAEGFGEKHFCP